MLTTGPRSRRRAVLGGVAVAALTVAGLGATASGTAAAASMRAGVEKETGIDIAEMAVAPQSAPSAPSAPLAPSADLPPPPPPPARAPSYDRGAVPDTAVRKIKMVKMDKDGKVLSEEMRGIPEISSVNCDRDGRGGRSGEDMIVNKMKDGRRVMLICTDRIQRVAMAGAAEASRSGEIERRAYASALEGLRGARAGIVSDRSMSAEAKTSAMAGIDESIAEIEADMAKAD